MVLVGGNRPRLYATMLAAQSLGAIPVPLYQDAVAAECVFPINNADVRFAFAEDQEQVDKLLERASSARSWRTSSLTTRAACATTPRTAWPRWTA
jgi:long-subunit acyl-CoA synthetase (AMP-forming)